MRKPIGTSTEGGRQRSFGLDRMYRWTTSSREMIIGLTIVSVWIVIALLAPLIAPHDPLEPFQESVLTPPSSQHLLGTDVNGMDVLSRLLYAPRINLGIAVTATAVSFLLGVPIGTIAGYFEGRGRMSGALAQVILRIFDVTLALPVFVFALVLVATLGASVSNVILALVFVNTPVFVWLTRSEVLSARSMDFVEVARCSGSSELRIAFVHVLRNCLAAPLTQVSVVLGFAVMLTAGLSFVGAGVPVPTPEWGGMISQGASNMVTGQWWPALFPGIALASAVIGFAILGDGLKKLLDPRNAK